MAAIKYIFPPLAECADFFDMHAAPRLEKLSAKIKQEISIGYVRKMVVSGAFTLGIFYKSAKIIGIAIQYNYTDAFTGDAGVHLLCVCVDPGHNAAVEIPPIMDELAECFGYKFISMATPRAGWARKQSPGWAQRNVTWSKQYGR